MTTIIHVLSVPTPNKGQCPIRPALDGSQGNPMIWCSLKDNHAGPHSWEQKAKP